MRRIVASSVVACVAVTGFHLPTAVADRGRPAGPVVVPGTPETAAEPELGVEAETETALEPQPGAERAAEPQPEPVPEAPQDGEERSADRSSAGAGLPDTIAAVSTLAGSGLAESADGVGAGAGFLAPRGMHVIANVGYVFDTGYLRTVDLTTGEVRKVAGTGAVGYSDSTDPMAAKVDGTAAMADDGELLYFIANCPQNDGLNRTCLRTYSLTTGAVRTVRISMPERFLARQDGVLYGATSSGVTRVDPATGESTTIATIARAGGTTVNVQGMASDGRYLWVSAIDSYVSGITTLTKDPRLVRVDPLTGAQTPVVSENLPLQYSLLRFVGDRLYAVTSSRVVLLDTTGGPARTVAGQPTALGHLDGSGVEAWFDSISGLGSDGTTLYVTERNNRRVRALANTQEPERRLPDVARSTVAIAPALVSTFSGSGETGYRDGPASSAQFTAPSGLHVIGNRGYFVDSNRLRVVDLATGAVTTIAGTGVAGQKDSPDPLRATFGGGASISDDGQFLYVAHSCATSGNPEIRCLRKMSLTTGAVSTVLIDSLVKGITVAGDGQVYTAVNSTVFRIDPTDGTSSTAARIPAATSGWVTHAQSLTADDRYLWFASYEEYRDIVPRYQNAWITRIDVRTGEQVVLPAGVPRTGYPSLVSAGDYLYAATTREVVRIAKSDGATVSIAGDADAGGYRDGNASEARFSSISGIASNGTSLFVLDQNNRRIRSLVQGTWPTTGVGSSGPSRAETTGGRNPSQAQSQCCHGDPVNSATGELWDSVTDLRASTSGLPLAQHRHFSTWRKNEAGALGHGWSTDVEMHVRRTASATGSGLAGASAVEVVQENGSTVTFTRATDGTYSAAARVLATLTGDGAGGFVLARHGAESFSFDDEGRLTRVEDRNGNAHAVVREDDRVVRVESSTGAVLRYGWVGDRIETVTDALGREVRYEYSEDGDLVAVTGPDGAVTRYTYQDHRIETVTSPIGGVLTNAYDAANRVVTQTDALGYATTFEYGDGTTTVTWPDGAVSVERYVDNQLREVTTALGTDVERTRRMEYGPTNQVIRTEDSAGGMTTAEYDAQGGLVSATDELGRTTTFERDAAGRVLGTTAPDGTTQRAEYDERGNLVASTDATGATTRYTVNGDGTVAAEIDPTGLQTSYEYDAVGHVERVVAPDGSATLLEHDAAGRLLSETDGTGAVTVYEYDGADRVTAVTDPTGARTELDRDAEGGVTRMREGDGRTWTWSHDPTGQVVSATDPTGATTTSTYDGAGRVAVVTDPAGGTTEHRYDAAGNLVAVTDPLGRVTRTTYDARGLVLVTTTPGGATTRAEHDAAGQLVTVTDATGGATRTTYDEAGRPVTVTDGDGREVTATYDAAGRVRTTSTADGEEQTWEYDAAGRLLSYTDAAGASTTYTYSARGEVATRTDAAGRVTALTHDGAGRVVASTAPDGEVTELDHDAAGRVVAVRYPIGTADVSYAYDAAGRRTEMSDGTGTTAYAYDPAGRLAEVRAPAGTVTYERDLLGRVVTTTYPDGSRVAREWDAAGQITAVEDWAGGRYAFGWDDDGGIASASYPNGVTTSYDRDAAGRVAGIASSGPGGALLDLAYAYTDGGLLSGADAVRPGADLTTGYGWDDQARLARVTGSGAGELGYAAGGQVAALPDGTTLTYDDAGTLTSARIAGVRTQYSADARGNRVGERGADRDRTYDWDAANRLIGLDDADGASWTYGYDGDGLRATAAEADGTSRTFLWDVEGEIPLLLGDGAARYVYGPTGAPVAQHDDEHGWLYLHGDVIGSVRAVTGTDGATVAAADYTPYGTPVEVAGVALVGQVTAFGFAGEYTDPTGLVYLRARYLDPATAQFLSVDPLFDVSLSLYGYTGGNPLMFVDPLGLIWYQPWTWTAETWANIGVGAGAAALVVGSVLTGGGAALVVTGLTAISIGASGVALASDCGYSGWQSGICRERGISFVSSIGGSLAADTVKRTAMTSRHVADQSRQLARVEWATWTAAGLNAGQARGAICG